MKKIVFINILISAIFIVFLATATSVTAQFSSVDIKNSNIKNKITETDEAVKGIKNVDISDDFVEKQDSNGNIDTTNSVNNTGTTVVNTVLSKTLKDDIGLLDAQTKELNIIKILQRKDENEIEKAKQELLNNSSVKKEEEKDKNTEKDTDGNEKTNLNEISDIENKTQEIQKSTKEDILEKKKKIIERARTEKNRKEVEKDLDEDGISDYDEMNIYKTDPNNADSDGDGYIDGAEILSGFNPLNSSLDAVIKYENPKQFGVEETKLFAVGNIKVAETKIVKNKEIASKILFEGKSLPNSFVTLYIFSIPTVITVKTDKEGNWNYTLDKELEDGEHEIFVAMTDNSGKILAKSSPIPFVKQAAAVTVDKDLLSFQIEGEQPSFFAGGYLYLIVFAAVFIIGLVLVFMGIRLRRRDSRVDDN
jgi:hypothetical protein